MTNMGGGCLNRHHAIRETVTSKQEDLETAVEFVPRPRQQGLSLVAHWLRPKPATMASFFAGADTRSPRKADLCARVLHPSTSVTLCANPGCERIAITSEGDNS